jgi:hypothetical protein
MLPLVANCLLLCSKNDQLEEQIFKTHVRGSFHVVLALLRNYCCYFGVLLLPFQLASYLVLVSFTSKRIVFALIPKARVSSQDS